MPTLPPRPNLDHLRRQAKDLLQAAKQGDAEAVEQIRSVSENVTLASAQLAIARSYGFKSWAALKAEVGNRTQTLNEIVDQFLAASVGGRMMRAVQLLQERPEIATASFGALVVLGDVDGVRQELARDPELRDKADSRTGWTAIHAACASRWHRDPDRADGLYSVVKLLLDTGVSPNLRSSRRPGWTPLRCAVASASGGPGNLPIIRLLLDQGAIVDDDDLYLAGFASDPAPCVSALLKHVPDGRAVIGHALAAPIGSSDVKTLRLLLDAGADPNRYLDDDGRPSGAVAAAIEAGADVALVELLLERGADPGAPGHDGRAPFALAASRGGEDLLQVLTRAGARQDAGELDWLVFNCLHGRLSEARQLLAADPGLLSGLAGSGGLTNAAEGGNAEAVRLMLDLGVPIDVVGGTDGATALHAAAYAGSVEVVRLLLERGAPIDALDSRFKANALDWAVVGSGERPRTNPRPDWVVTVQMLLDAGSSTDGINLSPSDAKQPSEEVAEILRAHGVGMS